MKTKMMLITTLSLFTTSLASANATPLEKTMVQMDVGYFGKEFQVSVTEAGALSVISPSEEAPVAALQLKDRTANLIRALAYQLADAKIETTHSDIVCMMIAPGHEKTISVSSVKRQTGEFTGKLHLVLGVEGCWVADHIAPADASLAAKARELRSVLEVIVSEQTDVIL